VRETFLLLLQPLSLLLLPIRELNRELSNPHEKMRPFLIPQTVGQHREWTQEDVNQRLALHERQGEIIKELADLEGGHI
jgi:hypothetical protein